LINNFNENCLKPEIIDCTKEMIKIKEKQLKYYDKNTGSEEKEFYTGEKVLVQKIFNNEWLPAVIVKKQSFQGHIL